MIFLPIIFLFITNKYRIGSFGTYSLILLAFREGLAGYIVSIREIFVAFGSLLGFLLLREPFTLKKGLGMVITVDCS